MGVLVPSVLLEEQKDSDRFLMRWYRSSFSNSDPNSPGFSLGEGGSCGDGNTGGALVTSRPLWSSVVVVVVVVVVVLVSDPEVSVEASDGQGLSSFRSGETEKSSQLQKGHVVVVVVVVVVEVVSSVLWGLLTCK